MSLGAQTCPQRKGSPRDLACIPFPMGSETLQEGPGPKSSQRKRKKMGQISGIPPHSALGRDPRVPVPLTWYMHILGLIPLGSWMPLDLLPAFMPSPHVRGRARGAPGATMSGRGAPCLRRDRGRQRKLRGIPHGIRSSHIPVPEGPEAAPGSPQRVCPCVLTQIAPSTPRGSEGPSLARERRLNPRIP